MVNWLKAAVLYEKQLKADIFLYKINKRINLYKAYKLIYNLY